MGFKGKVFLQSLGKARNKARGDADNGCDEQWEEEERDVPKESTAHLESRRVHGLTRMRPSHIRRRIKRAGGSASTSPISAVDRVLLNT